MNLGDRLRAMSLNGFDPDLELNNITQDESIPPELDELESISITNYVKVPKFERNQNKPSLQILDKVDNDPDLTPGEKAMLKSNVLLDDSGATAYDEFDSFFDDDDLYDNEEDYELTQSLLANGRRYNRENQATKESGEIHKAFAESEKRLDILYNEVDNKKQYVQKHIDLLKKTQRGGKTMTDMYAVDAQLISSQLAIIKEAANIKKTKFDLITKEQNRKAATAQASPDVSTNTLQSLFAATRAPLMNGTGGFEATTAFSNTTAMDDFEDPYDPDEEETEGDIRQRYEHLNITIYALVENGAVMDLVAEDDDGNVIHDYPVDNDIDDLNFKVDMSTGKASDKFHRNYTIRVI